MLDQKAQAATGLSEAECNHIMSNMSGLAEKFASTPEPEAEAEPEPEAEPEVEDNGPSDSEIDEDIIEGKIEEFYEEES